MEGSLVYPASDRRGMQGAHAWPVPGSEDDSVRVLYVDDHDGAFAEVAARHLEGIDGARSVEAEHVPGRALERLAAESFDVVVSEYEMSGRNGLELLRAVRVGHRGLPFLLFTGSGSETVAENGGARFEFTGVEIVD